MDRGYTIKDINEIIKVLGPIGKIKVVGKTIVKLPGRCVNKMKGWYKGKVAKLSELRGKLDEYVADEAKIVKENEANKLNSKIEIAQDVFDTYRDNEAYTTKGTIAYDYLKGLDDRITYLKDKQAKLSGKKVSFLRTSSLALKKVTTNKIEEMRNKRKQKEIERENTKSQLATAKSASSILQSEKNLALKMQQLQKQMEELKKQKEAFNEANGMTIEEYLKNFNLDNTLADTEETEIAYHR